MSSTSAAPSHIAQPIRRLSFLPVRTAQEGTTGLCSVENFNSNVLCVFVLAFMLVVRPPPPVLLVVRAYANVVIYPRQRGYLEGEEEGRRIDDRPHHQPLHVCPVFRIFPSHSVEYATTV